MYKFKLKAGGELEFESEDIAVCWADAVVYDPGIFDTFPTEEQKDAALEILEAHKC